MVQMQPAAAPAPTSSDDEEATVDLRGLLLTLWRGRWIILICVLLAGVLGVLAVSQLTPRYKASAKVMFDIQQANVVNIEEVLTDQQFDSSRLEDQVEVLRSTNLIERVIDVLDLAQHPEFNVRLRPQQESLIDRARDAVSFPPEILDILKNVGIIKPDPPVVNDEEQNRRDRLQVINNVLAGLSLKPVGKSRVIEVSFTSGSPRLSARIVNAVGEQYIIDQLEAKLEATRAATSWLSTRVDELRIRVQTAEEAIEDARAVLSAESGQTLEITQQQLEALNGSLAQARSDTQRLQSLYDRLKESVALGRDLGAISEFRNSVLIQSYREQETELENQETVLASTVSEGHPALTRIRQQLETVRKNISDEAARIIAAAEIDLNAAKAQEDALITEVRRLEEKALEQSSDEVALRQLNREAEASRVLYENFLARLQETAEQEDLQAADARVLSPADSPLFPESQRKNQILIFSLLLGTAAGIGIVFLLDRLNNTFRSPMQLEEMAGETVLATLPALGSRMKRVDVVTNLRNKPSSSLAESIRNLRTSILFSNVDNPPKVIMFTSTVPREGKSTTSMLVAMTSKQMGKSAIIVDCDLRLPAIARIMENVEQDENKPGLMAVMEGTADVSEAIFQDPETGLHMLMTQPAERHGKINAADVLSSRRFQDLIQALSKAYDLVILDTPPALVVTDARIISRLADAVVYAVRWDSTPRGAVIEGLKELKTVNAPIAGLVLTMVNEARASRYAYDGYSYYRGRYKDYYVSE